MRSARIQGFPLCGRKRSVRNDGSVSTDPPVRDRPADLLAPLLVLGAVVALVSAGAARGLWLANLHNGLLALAFGCVAAWTLLVRHHHREAMLFAAVGVLESVVFLGRQVAHDATGHGASWWGWIGVWPLAVTLAALTWAVFCFPDGRALSPSWRHVAVVVTSVAALLSLCSALWPVEYAAADLSTPPPFRLGGARHAEDVWRVVAHPTYALIQVSWLLAVLARWRRANGMLRNQLAVLGVAVGVATVALLAGLAIFGSPRAGLLTVPLVPVAAGWGMVGLSLSRVVEEKRARGGLAGLSSRENEVLDLMAQGLSNKAIADQLHLSLKTVEPIVSSIFTKLELPADGATNRRVLAVRALLEE
jgi:DNA-binding CsgD family transcriptional regulator